MARTRSTPPTPGRAPARRPAGPPAPSSSKPGPFGLKRWQIGLALVVMVVVVYLIWKRSSSSSTTTPSSDTGAQDVVSQPTPFDSSGAASGGLPENSIPVPTTPDNTGGQAPATPPPPDTTTPPPETTSYSRPVYLGPPDNPAAAAVQSQVSTTPSGRPTKVGGLYHPGQRFD